MSVKVTCSLTNIRADVTQLQLYAKWRYQSAWRHPLPFFDVTEYGDSKFQNSRKCILLINRVTV